MGSFVAQRGLREDGGNAVFRTTTDGENVDPAAKNHWTPEREVPRTFPFSPVDVHVTKLNAGTYFPPHVQCVYQLYCLLAGEVEYAFGDGTIRHLHPREAFLIPPYLRRSPRSRCADGRALVIVFRGDSADFRQELTHFKLNEAQFQCAAALLQAEITRREPHLLRMIRVNALLLELLGSETVARLCPDDGGSSGGTNVMARKIEFTEELMKSNLEHPLPLSALVRVVGVSRPVLERGFRKYRGVSVMARYRDLRLDAAKIRLQQGASISETAYGTGFKTTQHFATVFRRRFHVTPSNIELI
ncbi:MAG: helix-turn-helix domain-containing protein [Lentisphaeria bacterium]|nr:helix-turn-helix domain-containing protein [Lentisphaeria bacterium]